MIQVSVNAISNEPVWISIVTEPWALRPENADSIASGARGIFRNHCVLRGCWAYAESAIR